MICGAGNNCVGVRGGGAIYQTSFHRCDCILDYPVCSQFHKSEFRISFVDISVLFQLSCCTPYLNLDKTNLLSPAYKRTIKI